MDSYSAFLAKKTQLDGDSGFEPVWMPDALFDFQSMLTEWGIRKGRAAIFSDCGTGKGSPPDTPVLTPSGFKAIGGLGIGDEVISRNGRPYSVTGVYFKAKQDIFKFHYSDGASLVVDFDHLHICRTNNDRQRGKPWRVLSTKQLLTCNNIRYGKDDKSRNYDIPIVEPVEFTDGPPKTLAPYTVGALLGDGGLSQISDVRFSSMDQEIIDRLNRELSGRATFKHKNGCDYRLKTGCTGPVRHPVREFLYQIGMMKKKSNAKHIPSEYLYAKNPRERLDLLRGLMDTDGYIDIGGCCQFYSVSKKLADGVTFLVRSLGGIPTQSWKKTSCDGVRKQDCFIVTFSLKTYNPFYLSRKAQRWNPNPRDNGRWIDRVEHDGQSETVCISVDSPDSSYVTSDFIVTHNTAMQLAWAENVMRHTNKSVLVLTPLAVSTQTVREGEKFGIECRRSQDGKTSGTGIYITNYERLHYFDTAEFAGAVCDESAILKFFGGKRRQEITEFMRTLPYRLLCTATAAPNDFFELGTSSEALGYLGYQDMLGRFFKEDVIKDYLAWGRKTFRFRGHAETPFWRWVCSWARSCRKPSDMGFEDRDFILPPLIEKEYIVGHNVVRPGLLFAVPAKTLNEQREERRITIKSRCEAVAEKVTAHNGSAVSWCHLNKEADTLEEMIPDALQISGSMSDEKKEERLLAFQDGELKRLVIKPRIACHGLNWQHCHYMTCFPSHSFESYYQSVRRCWRFGQKNPVKVDIITTEGEVGVLRNIQRKAKQADRMFDALIEHMGEELHIERKREATKKEEVPKWLTTQS